MLKYAYALLLLKIYAEALPEDDVVQMITLIQEAIGSDTAFTVIMFYETFSSAYIYIIHFIRIR